jgi:tryptophan 2,3-dioxygenase
MNITPELELLLKKLDEKYAQTGQGLMTYLELLEESDYLSYWDYIQLETLLSLQRPRTRVPDEPIFIMYHQITELYFKLIVHEIDQIAGSEANSTLLREKLFRINQYFEALTHSFGVMEHGMQKEQFMQFRKALVPASGFQSFQYRAIELGSTDFVNLVHKDHRNRYSRDSSIEDMFEHVYWKSGATDEKTGQKAFTLVQFEQKYSAQYLQKAHAYKSCNLWQKYLQLPADEQQTQDLIDAFKLLDLNVNVYWPLQHYKTAVRYLAASDAAATGGSNWQKYLPPRFMKRVFYPQLWSEKEMEEWGKSWVEETIKKLRSEAR